MTFFAGRMMMAAAGVSKEVGPPMFVGGVAIPSDSGSASVAVNAIPEVQAGDILLCLQYNAQGATRSISSRPSGWSNLLARSNSDGGNAVLDIKTATGSEPGSYTWTWNNSSSITAAAMVAYRNVSAVNAIPGAFDVSEVALQTLSSITPTLPGVLVGFFSVRNSSASVTTTPSGMDVRVPPSVSFGTPKIAVCDLIPSPAGATGTKEMLWSVSNTKLGALIQLS